MKSLIKNLKIMAIAILAISLLGCDENDEENSNLPQVTAGFTFTVNQNTGVVSFINISEKANDFTWDFGNETSSTEINPIKVYTDGEYAVVLTASNDAGGMATARDTVTIAIPETATLPFTFDEENVDYDFSVFDGASFGIVENPDVSGSNNKETNVGAITNSGNVFEGVFFELGADISLTTQQSITMNFWSDQLVDVLLKLEGTSVSSVETSVRHEGTGWESLTFDFTSSDSYSVITIFVDGPGTTSGIFYIDDVVQAETAVVIAECTEETEESLDPADLNITFQTDPSSLVTSDGGSYSMVSNPDADNELNASCNVAQIARDPSLQFANTQFTFDTKFDFNTNSGLKMKVYSAETEYNVLVKLEDKSSNGSIFVESPTVTTVGTNEWEELTFDFASSESGKYDRIVIFFELNTFTDGIYFIDDIALNSGDGGGEVETCMETNLEFPIDFDCEGIDYATKIVGNVSFTVVTNPEQSGLNSEATMVGQITNVGANWENAFFNLDNALDFSAGNIVTMKFFSNQAVPILLKFEDGTAGAVEDDANHSGTGWEELTFEVSSTDSYNSMVIFVDGPGTTGGVFYVDDIVQTTPGGGGSTGGSSGGGSGGIVTNGDFETGDDTGWALFQNGGTSALDNTINNGGTWSGKLATGGPSNPAFKQERIAAGTVAAGDVVQIQFDHIGSIVAPGGVFNVILFGEGSSGASFTHVFNPAPVLVGSWSTFTGSFTIDGATDVSEGISFLIEAVCGGDAGCSVSANIDNVSITLNP